MKLFGRNVFSIRRLLGFAGALTTLWTGSTSAQVVINELLAINRETIFPVASDTNYSPAYVELYNTSAQAIDLSTNGGWSMSKSLSKPRDFVFTNSTIIPAQGFLLLYLDDATNRPGLHVDLDVRDNGDDFNLYNPSVLLVDRLFFGMQLNDVALARTTDGTGPFDLMRPTPGLSNEDSFVVPSITSTNLRINEWMAKPSGTADDWFEIYNLETNIVNISGISFNDLTFIPFFRRELPPFSFIGGQDFLEFTADGLGSGNANSNRYDHVDFKLSASGEQIMMVASNGLSILDFVTFGPQVDGVSEGRLPDGSTNIVRPLGVATPESSNFQLITNVVVNEVLAHTDPPLEDAIELYNPLPTPVDISYWWLSNSKKNPRKYRIPPNTIIPPYGYKVFYEYIGGPPGSGFNTSGTGDAPDFTLNSAQGDQVFLFSAANDLDGTFLGSQLGQQFGASENGVSFGRYTNSVGEVRFIAMKDRTFGQDNPATLAQFRMGEGLPNSAPRNGPLVVNEIMYHPPDILFGTNAFDDSLNEYIEVFNAGPTTTTLYDPTPFYFFQGRVYASGWTNTWHVRGEVDFDFPPNVVLPSGGYLLLVNFSPTNFLQLNAFTNKYGIPAEVPIFGPYKGKLSNNNGAIELKKPDAPQAPDRPDAFDVPYIVADKIKYNDSLPWPQLADGFGASLQRLTPEIYGNDPIEWVDSVPSPGRHQGIRIGDLLFQGDRFVFGFQGVIHNSYTVEYKSEPDDTIPWIKLMDVPALQSSGTQFITNNGLSGINTRIYRVVTPSVP